MVEWQVTNVLVVGGVEGWDVAAVAAWLLAWLGLAVLDVLQPVLETVEGSEWCSWGGGLVEGLWQLARLAFLCVALLGSLDGLGGGLVADRQCQLVDLFLCLALEQESAPHTCEQVMQSAHVWP